MRYTHALLLSLLFSFSAFAQNAVQITFDHTVKGLDLDLEQTEFAIWNGKMTNITRAEFYLSKIELISSDGSVVPLTDFYILANANEPSKVWDAGTYDVDAITKIRFGLGVDADVNHLDPTTYDANHPLAPQDPSMHWGWAAGYRFMALEGWVDKDASGDLESIYQFHNLDDDLYRTIEMDCNLSAENNVLTIPFTLDYSKLFSTIPMEGNVIQHGSDWMNEKMMDNAVGRGFFSLPESVDNKDLVWEGLELNLAPNPSTTGSTSLDYVFPTGSNYSLKVFNTAGQVVLEQNDLQGSGKMLIKTTDWTKGVHAFIFYKNGQKFKSEMLLVQ